MLIPQILTGTERESTPILYPTIFLDDSGRNGTLRNDFNLHVECVVPAVLEYDCHAPRHWMGATSAASLPSRSLTGSRLNISARVQEFLDDVYFGIFP